MLVIGASRCFVDDTGDEGMLTVNFGLSSSTNKVRPVNEKIGSLNFDDGSDVIRRKYAIFQEQIGLTHTFHLLLAHQLFWFTSMMEKDEATIWCGEWPKKH